MRPYPNCFPRKLLLMSSAKMSFCYTLRGVNIDRNHPVFTFLYHYQQYVQVATEPYSYTQFLEHYRRKFAKEKGSMKLKHETGKEMFIDFAGKKLHIVDKETGEVILSHRTYYF